jgi:predicted dehydrogenase
MSESINRRTFLGATAASGLAMAGQAVAQNAAPDKVIVGVMGTGGRGTSLCSLFQRQPGVEVAYVCDVDRRRAENAAGVVQKISNRAPRVVEDFRRILDDNTVNILVVGTCNHWHAPASILACAAGKHVYVEKPCSYSAREGEWLVAAARKHKKHVQMGNQRRSWPKIIEGIELVRKGAIGRAYFAESWYNSVRGTIGRGKPADPPKELNYDLWQGPAPRRPFRTNYLPYTWHWFWHWGNGELGNNGIHLIDLCRWGLGVNYPTRVTSVGGRYRYEDDWETPDTQIVNYQFEGRKQIQWEGMSCSRRPAHAYHMMFHGDQGTMTFSDSEYIIYDPDGKPRQTEKIVSGDNPHALNLLAAVRGGNAPLNSEIEDGHKSTLLCHLGNISQRTGRVLRCDPKNGHILDDKEAMALWTREYDKNWEPRV